MNRVTKWCAYCQKSDHNDSECWCTRASQPTGAYQIDFSKLGKAWTFPGPMHFGPCNCVGPQNGEPRCPCQMRKVIKRDGRWIQPEVDLGPAA